MADAWTVLVTNSSLPSGDAWEHLNAQAGGGGGEVWLIEGLGVAMEDNCIDVAVEPATITVAVEPVELAVELDTDPMEVEICNEH